MLDNHIGHKFAVSVALLVQTVDLVELNFPAGERTIVGASEDRVSSWVHANTPDPVAHLANDTKLNTFLVPEGDFAIAASHEHVLARRVEADRARVKAKLFVGAYGLYGLATADGVDRELLVPATTDQDVVTGIKLLGAEAQAPHRLT